MKKRRTNEDRQAPLFWGLTPNQLVGYNLWQARQLRGWTQAEAAQALEPHLGVRWTVAQVSAAERSIDGGRIRQFTADDIVAFAQAFELPVTYFFLPTQPHAKWTKVKPDASSSQLNRTMAVMIDLIFGDPNAGAPEVANRLHDSMRQMDPSLYTDAQQRIFELARQRMLAVAQRAVGSFAALQQSLRGTADDLAELASDAANVVAGTLPSVSEKDMLRLLNDEAPK